MPLTNTVKIFVEKILLVKIQIGNAEQRALVVAMWHPKTKKCNGGVKALAGIVSVYLLLRGPQKRHGLLVPPKAIAIVHVARLNPMMRGTKLTSVDFWEHSLTHVNKGFRFPLSLIASFSTLTLWWERHPTQKFFLSAFIFCIWMHILKSLTVIESHSKMLLYYYLIIING